MKYKFLIFFSILLISCNTPEHYSVTGVIKSINKEDKRLLIDHNAIPGFMTEMEMFFNLHESVDLNKFAINDSVSFNLIIKNKNSYTINYKKLGKSSNHKKDDFFFDEDEELYSLKEPGDFISDATFSTIYNNKVKLTDFKSKFIAISFIFSKCPMPTMCPASVYKNQYLSNSFNNEDIVFLMVSFDHIYDTPEVLKNIYENLNTQKLVFLSSHNHVNDITVLAEQTGIGFWGVEENNIGHTMRTVILDKNLKFIKSFDGTDWLPGEAKKDIENLIKIYQ